MRRVEAMSLYHHLAGKEALLDVVVDSIAHDGHMLGWCDSQAEFEFTLDLYSTGSSRSGEQTGGHPGELVRPLAESDERIPHVERFELPEVAIVRVEGSHSVLKQNRSNVRVWYQIATHGRPGRDVQVGVHEAVTF